MTTWNTHTDYQGHAVNAGTLQILKAMNKMLAREAFGSEKGDATMLQGGYNKGGVAASAGTHDGGGAFDLTPFNWKNRVKALRLLGCAAWHRPYNWDNRKGGEHIHVEVCGDSDASAGGKDQVIDYYKDKNGLANNAKDADWRPAGIPILFHMDTDLRPLYATRLQIMHDAPAALGKPKGTLKKGAKFTPVAKVTNKSHNYWYVNLDGKCIVADNLTHTPPKVEAAPEPPKPAHFDLAIGTYNIIRWRLNEKNTRGVANFKVGADYEERVKYIVRDINHQKLEVFTTQESGTYADRDLLVKQLGGKWAGILHGDNAGDITNAVYWDGAKFKLLKEGKFQYTGTDHNWTTWVHLQELTTGRDFYVTSSHLEWHSGSSTYTKRRAAQSKEIHDKMEAINTNNAIIVFTGDYNNIKEDNNAGSKAIEADGYISVSTKYTAKLNSYNGLRDPSYGGLYYDQILVNKERVAIKSAGVYALFSGTKYAKPFATDHNLTWAIVTI